MYILLRLKSPLQSWGDNSRKETSGAYRGTHPEPTMSGITGLICACMGINYKRDSEKYSEVVNSIKLVPARQALKVPTILKDYHTMGGGYNFNTYEKNMVPVNIGGKTSDLGDISNSKLSTREYLEDSDFFVELQVQDSIAHDLIRHLENPTWLPYFGRACNIPSTKIYQGAFNTHEECLSFKEAISV